MLQGGGGDGGGQSTSQPASSVAVPISSHGLVCLCLLDLFAFPDLLRRSGPSKTVRLNGAHLGAYLCDQSILWSAPADSHAPPSLVHLLAYSAC